ncbi:MAG: UDP-N-acetylmuramate--L-alanine ligase [Actinomycetales bacterium]|uniref:UDP-N-acetylmuramate--L-alanine ligase n=1 Tax=Candidatus Phosphoribacter hodrii TaxID=2953743 RepID=A0A9D7T9Z6_9MICO|nr:UDP-N-acetylmuramate--L-alanine ligase [Candidatus Phosphoribacter hodrii]
MTLSSGLPPTRFDYAAPVPPIAALGAVHLIGIGGAGMSAIARMLLARGLLVTGSDSRESASVDALTRDGIGIRIGQDAANVTGVQTVVVSSAIREDNPELAAARAAGLRVMHRSQALAALAADSPVRIAIAGANGKTTTSSMLAVVLTLAGRDPSYAVGGDPVQLDANARAGTGEEFVIEADESDGSFVGYHPHVALVTSVQPDHLDFYGTAEAVEAGYRAFVDTLDPGGLLVACLDDPGARRLADLARSQGRRVVGYGFSADAQVRLSDARLGGLGAEATIEVDDAAYPMRLSVPGEHNLLNAAGVLAVALFAVGASEPHGAGRSPERVIGWLDLLSRFSGVRRRFERVGEAVGVVVVDDYAHNPAKVRAAVATGRGAVEAGGRLVVVFQPHLYSRTRDFAAEFGAALAPADVVVVTDVYAAREDPLPGVTGALVADAVRGVRAGVHVEFVPDLGDVVPALTGLVAPGDLVLTVGAGDITSIGPALLLALGARSIREGQ